MAEGNVERQVYKELERNLKMYQVYVTVYA